MEKEMKERLETALIDFIERVAKEPSSDKETEILPEMAKALVTLHICCSPPESAW